MDSSSIGAVAREVLEGNMREIVGQMRLEDMVSDRQKFAELVKKNADPDLASMGLEIISFNVQNFIDANGVIENLGVDNVTQISKEAAIAKANAEKEISIATAQATQEANEAKEDAQISRAQSERDIAIEKAKAAKEANDAKAEAQEAIAERNAQLETKQAALKKDVDTKKAQADAAMSIEGQNQRQLIDVASKNADIAAAEKEAQLKQREIELAEYELTAQIRKQADAERYAAEQRAAAAQYKREREAEAKKFELTQEAEALKIEAEAKKFAAFAEAEGIAAVGAAEAEAIQKKAEAQKIMGEASIIEMYLNTLPQIVANASAPLTNVDKITMYGEGNSAKLVEDVMKTSNQILDGLGEQGIDLKALLAGAIGGKLAN